MRAPGEEASNHRRSWSSALVLCPRSPHNLKLGRQVADVDAAGCRRCRPQQQQTLLQDAVAPPPLALFIATFGEEWIGLPAAGSIQRRDGLDPCDFGPREFARADLAQ